MEKICNGCCHEWSGDKDDKICPKCHKQEAFNIYFHVLDWDRDYDDYLETYAEAEKQALELVEQGCERVAIYTLWDNGEDATFDGEGVAHFGSYYAEDDEDDSFGDFQR